MSLTAHPDKDELLMFGGEHFTGNKVSTYGQWFQKMKVTVLSAMSVMHTVYTCTEFSA